MFVVATLCVGCAHRSETKKSSRYMDVDGVHLYYEVYGSGSPLVLLHGAAMVAEGWSPLIGRLAPHFTVYVPERRGLGRSNDREGEWTYAGMAGEMAGFMDRLGIRRAAIVGLSDGGNIGLILASTRPDLVSRLVVSGANFNVKGLGSLEAEFARMTPEEIISTAPPQVQPWIEIHKQVAPDRGANLLESFAKMKQMWLNYEIPESALKSISMPTLVMAGDRDLILTQHTVELWSAIPGAQLFIVPNADHFWLLTMPDLASQAILRFLASPADLSSAH